MLASHSNVSFNPLSETNVTLYPREVVVEEVCIPLVAALGAVGANPWAETARRARERALGIIVISLGGQSQRNELLSVQENTKSVSVLFIPAES